MSKYIFNTISNAIHQRFGKSVSKIISSEYYSRNLPGEKTWDEKIKPDFKSQALSYFQEIPDVDAYLPFFKTLHHLVDTAQKERPQPELALDSYTEDRERQCYKKMLTCLKKCSDDIIKSSETPNSRPDAQMIVDAILSIWDEAYWLSRLIKEIEKQNKGRSLVQKVTENLPKEDMETTDSTSITPLSENYDTPATSETISNFEKISDPNLFQRDFQIGFALCELRLYRHNADENIKKLHALLGDDIYNNTFGEEFDFTTMRLQFFSSPSIPFSRIAGLGYMCCYFSIMQKRHKMDQESKEAYVHALRDNFMDIICDWTGFVALLENIYHYSYASQCENIMRFLNPCIYNDDVNLQISIRKIVETYVFQCRSIEEGMRKLVTLETMGQIVGNESFVEACNWLRDHFDEEIDEENFALTCKYKIWKSHSLWEDEEYYENICMDLIEVITRENKTRKSAIEYTAYTLSTIKETAQERDIQIFERVLHEFCIATNKEYDVLYSEITDN